MGMNLYWRWSCEASLYIYCYFIIIALIVIAGYKGISI
jgi:hypothetical protein